MFPALPEAAARQSFTVGHTTTLKLSSSAGGSTRARVQDCAPPPGLVETKRDPLASAATQSAVFGQDIESIVFEPSILATFHLGARAAGSLEVTTSPLRSSGCAESHSRAGNAVYVLVAVDIHPVPRPSAASGFGRDNERTVVVCRERTTLCSGMPRR